MPCSRNGLCLEVVYSVVADIFQDQAQVVLSCAPTTLELVVGNLGRRMVTLTGVKLAP
jgi:hypothetical protein